MGLKEECTSTSHQVKCAVCKCIHCIRLFIYVHVILCVCMHMRVYIYISLSLSPCVCVSVCLRVPPSISGGWGWSPLLSSGSCKQVYQMGNTPSRERVGMRLAPKNFLEKSPLPQLNHVLPEPHEILPPRNTSTK